MIKKEEVTEEIEVVDEQQEVAPRSSLLTEVAESMKEFTTDTLLDTEVPRGEALSMLLEDVAYSLGEIGRITEGKIDVDFLLMIVVSYLVGVNTNKLDQDIKTPGELFEERIIPLIDNVDITTEEVKEDEENA